MVKFLACPNEKSLSVPAFIAGTFNSLTSECEAVRSTGSTGSSPFNSLTSEASQCVQQHESLYFLSDRNQDRLMLIF